MKAQIKLFCILEEESVQTFFKEALEGPQWKIYTLNTLEDAYFRIPDFAPDLILIDSDLCDASSSVIRDWDTGRAKIISFGKLSGESFITEYLEKPVSPDGLSEKLKSFL